VPCLRWKQGEYQAVLHLSSAARGLITPLIEVPEIRYDFEEQKASKTIDEHLSPFAKRVVKKWGTGRCLVDFLRVPSGELFSDRRDRVATVLEELRSSGCQVTPVTGLTRSGTYQKAVGRAAHRDKFGLCIRINLEEAARSTLRGAIDGFLRALDLPPEDCDIVLDLGAPNFIPIAGFAKLIGTVIPRIPRLARWRTFTVLGTSFPSTMAEIKRSPAMIPRHEWVLYRKLVADLSATSSRLPTFGDYTINHPDVIALDMRLLKPTATIRYTTDDAWLIVKGTNVRDNKFGQYRDHCRTVLESPAYMGAAFSKGDAYIADCAAGRVGTGTLTVWRRVGTNHHLEKVARDISNLFGLPSIS
jgi:hypothetical protein